MAVEALHKMDVVRAFRGFVGGVHFFHIETAIREFRVAFRTGGPRLLPMALMARQTA